MYSRRFTLVVRLLRRPIVALGLMSLAGCASADGITALDELSAAEFGVPSGTAADQLVLSRFPRATLRYYPTIADAANGVKRGEVLAAAYDEPILRNIAAKDGGLRVLSDPITIDQYGFAFQLGNTALKSAFDSLVATARASGLHRQMMNRWLPVQGAPQPMPTITTGDGPVLRFGTAPVTEPFSFTDGAGAIVGFDLELAARLAARLGRRLEVVEMEFGNLLNAVATGQVDFVGACITITAARSQLVLFSNSYYTGGISALVKK